MANKSKNIVVEGVSISLYSHKDQDYICITDMLKAKEGDFFVSDWLRNANTLDYLLAWETINNPSFNYGEFATIRMKAGNNSHKLSVKEWVTKTNAVGIVSKAGRYGGTYAHKDIALQFAMWISPAFQLYIIREYQRLKEIESNQYSLEWSVKRILSKNNYQLHTDAVKNYVLPKSTVEKSKQGLVYAEEADIINLALWGCTAKEWREANPQRVLAGENIRDIASINELIVLSNLEQANAIFLTDGKDKDERLKMLSEMALTQLSNLKEVDYLKSVKRLSSTTYLDVLGEGGTASQ